MNLTSHDSSPVVSSSIASPTTSRRMTRRGRASCGVAAALVVVLSSSLLSTVVRVRSLGKRSFLRVALEEIDELPLRLRYMGKDQYNSEVEKKKFDDNDQEIRMSPLYHQGSHVGSVGRICASSPNKDHGNSTRRRDATRECLILARRPTEEEAAGGCTHGNMDDPNVVEVPSRLVDDDGTAGRGRRLARFYMYHSAHEVRGGSTGDAPGDAVRLALADDPTGPWRDAPPGALQYRPRDFGCESFHSPDVVFDEDTELAYMYVHGHECSSTSGRSLDGQPSFVLVSTDGLVWNPPPVSETSSSRRLSSVAGGGHDHHPGMVSMNLFYLRVFRWGGYYYGVAKTQEDGIGSLALVRADSPLGPFVEGPHLARGPRHTSLEVVGDTLFVFFTLITDDPERVLLGTVDLSVKDWRDWSLSPGPVLLSPELPYEHGLAERGPSQLGTAGCRPAFELRDPRFVRHRHRSSLDILSGILYYSVQGEGGFAAAELTFDLKALAETQRYKDHRNINDAVLLGSSLRRNDSRRINATSPRLPQLAFRNATNHRPTLISGTGRSGTTYICRLFTAVGVGISHDNDVDCGSFPGTLGAASWYHAFAYRNGASRLPGMRTPSGSFDRVVHLVRSPLSVIWSRARRMAAFRRYDSFLSGVIQDYEGSSTRIPRAGRSVDPIVLLRWSLRHWVRRNSFVAMHAEYRARIEDVTGDPLEAWRLCMASHGADACPELSRWRKAIGRLSTQTNTGHHLPNPHNMTFPTKSWEALSAGGSQDDRDYVSIALKLAQSWGYVVSNDLVNEYDLTATEFVCEFENEAEVLASVAQPRHWDCQIRKDNAVESE